MVVAVKAFYPVVAEGLAVFVVAEAGVAVVLVEAVEVVEAVQVDAELEEVVVVAVAVGLETGSRCHTQVPPPGVSEQCIESAAVVPVESTGEAPRFSG